jgi:NACHT domain
MPLADELSNWIRSAAECSTGQQCPSVLPWLIARVLATVAVLAVIGHYVGAYEGAVWLLKRLRLVKPPDPRAAVDPALRRSRFCSSQLDRLARIAESENWDDRHFTDIEAEVEGPRRITSLVRAIGRIREPCVLEGEPGSGKSVALRMLAKHVAQHARDPRAKHAPVPLYVNLRDLPAVPATPVDADYLKNFVIESVGDTYGDDAAFVRDSWDEYAHRNRWFFLLDSFDEIPEILHSEHSSVAIARYSAAIRGLLAGTGCRGVVASRRFNAPVRLPWTKVTILELSARRQERLIARSGLTAENRAIVRRYLAERASYVRPGKTIGSNPFLLSLLCEYVAAHGKAVDNDVELVGGHLAKLAERGADEPERASLPAEALVAYAEEVAVVFGTMPLVRTRDEIVSALEATGIPEQRAENILAALVQVKILSLDAHARIRSEDHFAFAHRRYQETLFVRRIVRDPRTMQAHELLQRSSSREYAVTLLQSQPARSVEPIVRTASAILDERAAAQTPRSIAPELGVGEAARLSYFAWNGEPAVPLLELLQEGFARRMGEVPDGLAGSVESLLRPRWDGGDLYDRTNVIRLGGLLPQPCLREYLASAFATNTVLMRRAAAEQATFLANVPRAMALRIRGNLADAILVAQSGLDASRIEALALRLPAWLQANAAIRRAAVLRAMLAPLRPVTAASVHFFHAVGVPVRLGMGRQDQVVLESSVLTAVLSGYFAGYLVGSYASRQSVIVPTWLVIALGAYAAFAVVVVVLFGVRSLGRLSDIKAVYADLKAIAVSVTWPRVPWRSIVLGFIIAGIIAGACMVLLILGARAGPSTPLGLAVGLGIIAVSFGSFVYAVISEVRDAWRRWRSKRALKRLRKQHLGDAAIVARARSARELTLWLKTDRKLLARDADANRSVSRILMAARDPMERPLLAGVMWLREPDHTGLQALDYELEGRLSSALAQSGGPPMA